MKHLLIDALSVTNLSGRHVLVGHVRQLVAALKETYRFTVLVGRTNAGLLADLPGEVLPLHVPVGPGWFERAIWMARNARHLCRKLGVTAVFSPSGMLSVGHPCPQVVLAQNPWPLMPGMAKGSERIKAMLQRREFARAHREANVMVFNSQYMQDLYAARFGSRQGLSVVAYQAIDESLFELGKEWTPLSLRKPMVLSVSVMARHKAVEVLVDAFSLLSPRLPGAALVLVGAWPEAQYRREIESLIKQHGLSEKIQLQGHVDAAELHKLYGQARVFCLLSRCESFGIPAVEAQAFGTPVVVATGTAAPEIVGAGGIPVPQDDASATVAALQELLTDDLAWAEFSASARLNSERFHWPACSAPMVRAVDSLGMDSE